jgi:hypothetical protein
MSEFQCPYIALESLAVFGKFAEQIPSPVRREFRWSGSLSRAILKA